MIRERIQPDIRAKSNYLASFRFINIDFGKKPPQIKSWKTHADPEKKQIMLDLDISYNADIKVDAGFTEKTPIAGIKSIKLEGILRVILAPLMEDSPIFGALTVYFPHRPVLELQWTGFAHLLNIPGLQTLSEKELVNQIGQIIVAPQHFSHPLAARFDLAKLQFLEPWNALRIRVIEAKNLVAKEILTKSSNPYVVICGGGTTAKTRVIHKNLNPKWNETFEILYSDLPDQEIEFNLMSDKGVKINQQLGSCRIRIKEVPERGFIDKWIDLENVKSGQLHIKVTRLRLLSDPTQLEEVKSLFLYAGCRGNTLECFVGASNFFLVFQVLKVNEQSRPKRDNEIASAVLYTYIEKGRGLPVLQMKKDNLKALAVVQVGVEDNVKKFGSRINNGEAEWKKRFQFLIRNPLNEELKLKVHNEHNKPIGSITVRLSRLLAASEMTLQDWLPLESTEQNSEIRVKLQLRVSGIHSIVLISSVLEYFQL
ncbi:extended synaptotagmin-1-like isoform X2 [Xenopus laevis]|uniref:Extended synaptotagmin-1-like isoform X2 n=1 Tax=Xenopus laevis TaxID=8355 RepID=A0A8J1MV36_XENLA|nr:extended synaptotagmin-1-like isoform X2 [Xenopus laevis]